MRPKQRYIRNSGGLFSTLDDIRLVLATKTYEGRAKWALMIYDQRFGRCSKAFETAWKLRLFKNCIGSLTTGGSHRWFTPLKHHVPYALLCLLVLGLLIGRFAISIMATIFLWESIHLQTDAYGYK